MTNDPYAALLHTGNCQPNVKWILIPVQRLNEAFQTLLDNHRDLKAQNDEILVRMGLEQQGKLAPVVKGKQTDEDGTRAGMGSKNTGDEGDTSEGIGIVGGKR